MRGPSVIPLTAPVLTSAWPDAPTSVNEPSTTKPPFWFGAFAITGVLVTLPTKAPGGTPAPVTVRPMSVTTIALSEIVELPLGAVAPASVRGPGTFAPPPSRQVPLGFGGTDWATQLPGRSTNALSPGPGYSSWPSAFLARGVFGPVGSKCTARPNRVSPAESFAIDVAALGGTILELAKLLPV